MNCEYCKKKLTKAELTEDICAVIFYGIHKYYCCDNCLIRDITKIGKELEY